MKSFKVISLLSIDANFGAGMVIPSAIGEMIPGTEKEFQAPRLEKGSWVVPLPEELKNKPHVAVLVPAIVAEKAAEEGWGNIVKWNDALVERWGDAAPEGFSSTWVRSQNGLVAQR